MAGRSWVAKCRSRAVHRQAKFNVPSPLNPSVLSNTPAATGSGKRAANTAKRSRIGRGQENIQADQPSGRLPATKARIT